MSYLGSVEFFVVILFGLGWAILEFVGRRLDKKRVQTAAAKKAADEELPSA